MAPRHLHRPIVVLLVGLVVSAVGSTSALAHGGGCPFSHGDGDNHHRHAPEVEATPKRALLPEELAEEEDLKLERFLHEHENDHLGGGHATSGLGLWLSAMGCSLLVSTASLICLVLLPVIFLKGKPSKSVVDSLAMFGAGAMLGDAFLHQLPHAFGGGHSHSHSHDHDHSHGHSHGHSFQDLSVGLSVLGGIVLFLVVEKLVRYIEEISSTNGQMREHGHHHHQHHHHYGYREKLKVDDTSDTNLKTESSDSETKNTPDVACEKSRDGVDGCLEDEKQLQTPASLRKRLQTSKTNGDSADPDELDSANPSSVKENVSSSAGTSSESSLVFGYLNLFSDGVHNFTDGMALGSAFLLYGPMGGWSRTLFLLAHELPQEIGDFGILIRSGFTVSKAIFFNFLSALVALLGTALALVLGKDPGHSSLIEGFTAGGFIYIAVAGVLPEMNSGGTTFRSTIAQLISLTLGIGVALSISLAE